MSDQDNSIDQMGLCETHEGDWVQGCEGCSAAASVLGASLDQLHAEVARRSQGLQHQGVPAQALQGLLLESKVDIVWAELFQGRTAFLAEHRLGEVCLDRMKGIQEQVNKQQLAAPQKQGLTVVRKGGKG